MYLIVCMCRRTTIFVQQNYFCIGLLVRHKKPPFSVTNFVVTE